jgi:trans-aconitate 2-methyltransferase
MAKNDWNPSLYQQKHSFVFEYGKDLLALLAPQSGEHILDVGCGTGQLTKSIADAGAIVTGLDFSPTMIQTAQNNFPHIEFVVKDASEFHFANKFDAVFSNAALHWVTRAEAAVLSIANALKVGGRFVAEFGGKGNVEKISSTIRQTLAEMFAIDTDHNWFFPTIGEYATLLEKHGFVVNYALLFDRPTKLEGEDGMRNWIEMFCDDMFKELSVELKEQALQRIEAKLKTSLYIKGEWFADYSRIRIVARKV